MKMAAELTTTITKRIRKMTEAWTSLPTSFRICSRKSPVKLERATAICSEIFNAENARFCWEIGPPMGKGSGPAISRSTMVLPGILCVFVLLFISRIHEAEAVWINLPASGTKCSSEEIQGNVIVLADYTVISDDSSHDHPTISARVTSPYGNTFHQKEKVTSDQFAFTTAEAGNYLACFWVDNGGKGVGASVNLDWKIGIAARDWDTVARKEKIEGVELELRKLEAQVQAIHQNLLYLKTREADVREVSERTNARVAWFSIMSLGVCIVVAILQLWHLKSFFQKKKLI